MTDKKKAKDGAGEKLPSTRQNVASGGFTRSFAGDKSLAAFKNLVNGMTSNLNPDAKETLTEQEWVESWQQFWAKDPSENRPAQTSPAAPASEPQPATAKSIEQVYPDVTKQIRQYEEAVWPACPHCGSSAHTAKVSHGIIGRAITMAASTSRIRLSAQSMPGNHYCWACEAYFDHFAPTALMSAKP